MVQLKRRIEEATKLEPVLMQNVTTVNSMVTNYTSVVDFIVWQTSAINADYSCFLHLHALEVVV